MQFASSSGSAPERLGRCGATGFASGVDAIGPNCTFVGRRQWHRSTLLIGSCARNIRHALEEYAQAQVTSLLDAAGSNGDSSEGGGVLIFEDQQRAGDPDGTRAALREWAARDRRVRLLLAQPLLYPRWSRTQRLALCRNMLAYEAARLPAQGVYVAVDLDCRTPPAAEVAGVLSSMLAWRATASAAASTAPSTAAPRWDVLTANTRAPTYYYDRWALRSHTLTLDYDCWFNATQRRAHGSCPEYAITIDRDAPPFAVESAFGGLGLYRAAAVRAALAAQCQYRGTKNSYMCEHVPFHLCMTEHRLAIGVLPSLTVHCGRTEVKPQRKTVHLHTNGTVSVSDLRAVRLSADGALAATSRARGTSSRRPSRTGRGR